MPASVRYHQGSGAGREDAAILRGTVRGDRHGRDGNFHYQGEHGHAVHGSIRHDPAQGRPGSADQHRVADGSHHVLRYARSRLWSAGVACSTRDRLFR